MINFIWNFYSQPQIIHYVPTKTISIWNSSFVSMRLEKMLMSCIKLWIEWAYRDIWILHVGHCFLYDRDFGYFKNVSAKYNFFKYIQHCFIKLIYVLTINELNLITKKNILNNYLKPDVTLLHFFKIIRCWRKRSLITYIVSLC